MKKLICLCVSALLFSEKNCAYERHGEMPR